MTQDNTANTTVRHYHHTTKHHLNRYAAGPDALDWDDQPEAFRWFDGAAKIDLPLTADTRSIRYVDLYHASMRTPQPLTLASLSGLLELSLGLSAWKQYGDARWALRCNPSSGNLHAEEAYVITNSVDQLTGGVYHYLSRDHQLERRCLLEHNLLPQSTLLIGLSSIQWREAWKYGERAYRYCQLDIGHAIAAVRYAAAVLGWHVQIVECASDVELATLLGIDRPADFDDAEPEHPDVLLSIATTAHCPDIDLPPLIQAAQHAQWHGQANVLSPKHMYQWPIIDEVSAAAEKPQTETQPAKRHNIAPPLASPCELNAATLIRRRRSAQAFDGTTHISSDAFYRILDMTLPRPDTPPWDGTPWRDNINLVLFIHRVEGFKPGLYALVRNLATQADFKHAVQREPFQWKPVEHCPAHLALYALVHANGQKMAATLSCHQGIAAQSCFSLGMIADCSSLIDTPWRYRHLYWEAGMIGQVLYLEAEAAGIQGTGIGCYFDDAVHDMLGINDPRWQSLYHFTLGGGLRDSRIQTIAPYAHLNR